MVATVRFVSGRFDTHKPFVRRGVRMTGSVATPLSRDVVGYVISLTGHANLRGLDIYRNVRIQFQNCNPQ